MRPTQSFSEGALKKTWNDDGSHFTERFDFTGQAWGNAQFTGGATRCYVTLLRTASGVGSCIFMRTGSLELKQHLDRATRQRNLDGHEASRLRFAARPS